MAPSFFQTSVSSSASSVRSTSSSRFGAAAYPYGRSGENIDFTNSYQYAAPAESKSTPATVRAIYSKDSQGNPICDTHELVEDYPYSQRRNSSSENLTATSKSFSRCGYSKDGQGFNFSSSYSAKGY